VGAKQLFVDLRGKKIRDIKDLKFREICLCQFRKAKDLGSSAEEIVGSAAKRSRKFCEGTFRRLQKRFTVAARGR